MKHFISLRPETDLPSVSASFQRQQAPTNGEPKSWYSIRNVSRSEAEIMIYDEIGFWGVTASDFIRDLAGISATTINLRINSPGGDVFDGVAIFNALKRHTAEVNVSVDGLAASAASFIAMSGDKVSMSPHSQMMIHEASGLAIGNAEDMRKLADMLDKTSDSIAAIYAERAGGTVDEWRARMKDETWYTDQGAVDAGLADEILGSSGAPPANNRAKNEAPPLEPDPEPEPEEPSSEPKPTPIDWKAVFQDAVSMAEDDLFAPV